MFSSAYSPLHADLGRTPDWLNNEHAQNNTLCSMSYWRSVEELEAFARTPIHIRSLKFLFSAGMGPKGHELGVIVRCAPPLLIPAFFVRLLTSLRSTRSWFALPDTGRPCTATSTLGASVSFRQSLACRWMFY